jgi:predicted small lipoprotein YifL
MIKFTLILFAVKVYAMRNVYAKLAYLSLLCIMLSACGTKGPLYIPEQQYPQDTQEAAPQPAPAAPASSY